MVHMHHSQPLKMKFGTNHFLGSETLVPLQYRVRVKVLSFIILTEVAGEGGPDLAPQKFLLSQQFRYLMRCKKYL